MQKRATDLLPKGKWPYQETYGNPRRRYRPFRTKKRFAHGFAPISAYRIPINFSRHQGFLHWLRGHVDAVFRRAEVLRRHHVAMHAGTAHATDVLFANSVEAAAKFLENVWNLHSVLLNGCFLAPISWHFESPVSFRRPFVRNYPQESRGTRRTFATAYPRCPLVGGLLWCFQHVCARPTWKRLTQKH